ncbi:hypothetical protein J2Y55_005451 [Bosea sp. BE125]|uniref:polysaccharide deacetylase family protein n=1 Tax=Bosea sp. BE125 TaxID=2817909 RepID=UPI0028622CA3|nr:polysaccharide deacetylase family protein [Bosea sp. BE125]MDR6874417.1 hypothetical protein [Bosea sp. BE125]
MSDTSLGELLAELDRWRETGRRLRLWLRDDDAVAPSPALDRLAGLSERFALPVLLAIIPMQAEPALVAALRAAPSLLPCQHGCRHQNHAAAGMKKSEFGAGRPRAEAAADIAAGRQRLGELLGASVLPVFVPPWNRIASDLAQALPEFGFAGLSCFRGFGLGGDGPALVNSDIDVMDWHGGRIGRSLQALALEIRDQLAARRRLPEGTDTLGLLLHHRDHDETAWAALQTLLATLTAHPVIVTTDPGRLFGGRSAA